MTRRRYLALLLSVLGFVAGGCVSLTPTQKATLTDVQRFADATAGAYGLMRIPVSVQPGTNLGIGGTYRQGNFYLNASTLNSGHLTALVAHELGHYVLGHEPTSGVSMAELLKAQELRELDANAQAVEILVRARGMTQPQAVRTMVIYLRSAQNAQKRGQANAPGHRPPSEEITDLLARFPQAAAPDGPGAGPDSSSAAIPIAAPTWMPGDQWTFWWDNPRSSGTFVWSVDREEVVDGTPYYVVVSGPSTAQPAREFFYQKVDLAWRMEMVNGQVESKAEPAQWRYLWPLTIGGAWEQTVTVSTERDGKSSTETRARSCQVTGEETVTVAGGVYRTMKTVCRDKATNEVSSEMWYAPEAKQWVKEWSRFPWGVQERELISVKLK
jgi:hypothetical protein